MLETKKVVQRVARTSQRAMYYRMGATQMAGDPRFIGGYFWWNYVEQMLPYSSSSYWSLLEQTISPLPAPR